MNRPAAAIDDVIFRTAEVLIEHTRSSISRCHCGWSELGASHPYHVAQALADAGLLVGTDFERAENAAAVDAAIRDYHDARKRLLDVVLAACPRHLPLDHGDGQPIWCKRCGRTTFGVLVGEVGT